MTFIRILCTKVSTTYPYMIPKIKRLIPIKDESFYFALQLIISFRKHNEH
jgi:hypothetical protein